MGRVLGTIGIMITLACVLAVGWMLLSNGNRPLNTPLLIALGIGTLGGLILATLGEIEVHLSELVKREK